MPSSVCHAGVISDGVYSTKEAVDGKPISR